MIVVLLVLAVLAVMIVEFNYEPRIQLHLADNFHVAAKALNCAEAGVAITMVALRQSEDVLADEALRPVFSGAVHIPVDEGYCTVAMTDESGKININALSVSDGRTMRHRAEPMLRLVDLLNRDYGERSAISYSLIPAIVDWVDPDDQETILPFLTGDNAGAENDFYLNRADPYPCKNAPFDVLSELLLLKGMTVGIFEGRSSQESDGLEAVAGMKQYLTIYGDGKININEAPARVIQSLSEGIDETLAHHIVEQRDLRRFDSIDQLQRIPGMRSEMYRAIREWVTVRPQSRYYTVLVTGVSGPFVRKIQLVLNKNEQDARVTALWRNEF